VSWPKTPWDFPSSFVGCIWLWTWTVLCRNLLKSPTSAQRYIPPGGHSKISFLIFLASNVTIAPANTTVSALSNKYFHIFLVFFFRRFFRISDLSFYEMPIYNMFMLQWFQLYSTGWWPAGQARWSRHARTESKVIRAEHFVIILFYTNELSHRIAFLPGNQ